MLCRCNYAERPGDKFEITLEWPFMVSQLLRGMRYICGNTILRGRRFVSGELAKESLVDIENSGYRSSCLCWCRPWLTILSEYEVLQGLGDPLSHKKKKNVLKTEEQYRYEICRQRKWLVGNGTDSVLVVWGLMKRKLITGRN